MTVQELLDFINKANIQGDTPVFLQDAAKHAFDITDYELVGGGEGGALYFNVDFKVLAIDEEE